MITIVSCYNNKSVYNEFLYSSVYHSSAKCELIAVDNTKKQFASIADAYNSVLPQVKTEWVLFCHQDLAFDSDFLSKLEEGLADINQAVVGFAGINDQGVVYSNLKYKDTKRFITRTQLEDAAEVFSIDECCFAVRYQDLLDEKGFDAEICSGWHLYAVELCLRFIVDGKKVICLPIELYHKNDDGEGLAVDTQFLQCLRKICIKYRKQFVKIFTPCYIIQTNPIKRELRILKTMFGRLRR